MNLSTEERMKLLANIIVDTIIEDQKQGGVLLKKILAEESARERQSQSKQHNDIPTKEGG
ncbi:MAG TPA: hypothetical protein VMB52_00535 [Verrucomicrobiae bacterium]|nr:hypothetical protein [Verrucomicrobiae bacterium]